MPTKPTGRPRGRPRGSKNIPKLEAFVAESLATSVPIPVVPPRRKGHAGSVWTSRTPEERSAYARELQAKRKLGHTHVGKRTGVPAAYTNAQWDLHVAAQKPIIARIIKKMADNDQLPDDPRAVEALEQTMLVLRSEVPAKDKIAAARLLLDFTKAKPTAKVEHTVRTAEDYLDELADD